MGVVQAYLRHDKLFTLMLLTRMLPTMAYLTILMIS